MCWYCGCHTTMARRDEPIAVYESALRCEIDQVVRQIGRRLKVEHIHFGGGTPTIMPSVIVLAVHYFRLPPRILRHSGRIACAR